MTSNRKKPGVAFWATVILIVGLIVAAGCTRGNGPTIAAHAERDVALPADVSFFVIYFESESAQSDQIQQKVIDELIGTGCELLDDIIVEDAKMHRITLRLPDSVSPEDVVGKLRTMRGVIRAIISSLVC
jgi:hypothetical protein